MRIIEVVPTIEIRASGPSYSVPRLAIALAARGHDVDLMTVGAGAVQSEPRLAHRSFPNDWQNLPVLKSLWRSRGMKVGLDVLARDIDLIHSNGLWVMPAVYPGSAAKRYRKPLVVSPRGTLSRVALTISSVKKRIFWTLRQRSIVQGADCIHVTSEQEYLDCRRFGLTQPISVIANGVDIPDLGVREDAKRSTRRILYLGRIHPIKGLENLLAAWSNLHALYPDWELRLVGPDELSYLNRLQCVVAEKNLPRVSFAGPRYGKEKIREYAEADLFVLPSFSENFGMSIAEALAQALPVVTTTGTPWAGLVEEHCGWWVSPDTNALANGLAEAMAKSPEALCALGANGRAWVKREFSWDHIAERMEAVYRWLVEGGAVPESVRLN